MDRDRELDELRNAIHGAGLLGADASELAGTLKRVDPDAQETAEIIAICAVQLRGRAFDTARPVLEAHLQRKLVIEHVAAQERMSLAAEALQAASLRVAEEAHKTSRLSFWLTLASVILGLGSLISAVLIANRGG